MNQIGVRVYGTNHLVDVDYAEIGEKELPNLMKIIKDTCRLSGDFHLRLFNFKFKRFFEIRAQDFPLKGVMMLDVVFNNNEHARLVSGYHSDILSSVYEFRKGNVSNLKHEMWEPGKFEIPLERFSKFGRSELELATLEANPSNERPHTVSPSLYREIRSLISMYLVQFTYYPTRKMVMDACLTLVNTYKFLANKSNDDQLGIEDWISTINGKMTELRRESKHPEVLANRSKPGRGIIKAIRGEVNFLPPTPAMSTEESLKRDYTLLMTELSTEHPDEEKVSRLMLQLFSTRREDIVVKNLPLESVMDKWPALFRQEQLFEEMKRIVLVHPLMTLTERLAKMFEGLKYKINHPKGSFKKPKRKRARTTTFATVSIKSVQDLLRSVHKIYPNELPLISDAEQALQLYEVAKQNNDIARNKAFLAPHIVQEKTGTFNIHCEDRTVCAAIDTETKAVALLISVYYAMNYSYPPQRSRTLELMAYLCGVDNADLSVRTKELIDFCIEHNDENE
ncbi:uncharacterized protein LOC135945638 [Cloeon dipterum]|uniref:uncharacterized protein LOC135945638 n=1 Tax=Cloeon dipterum TaxID=197152 RepID=UPI00321F7D44